MMRRLREAGVVKAAVLSGGRWGLSYESCLRFLEPYNDLVIPVAVVDPDETDRLKVWNLYAMGYRGLKMIGVSKPYDAPEYFPMYAAAEALNMPIVLHLGVIGGPVDYSRTHPRRDPEAVKRLAMMREMMGRAGRRGFPR